MIRSKSYENKDAQDTEPFYGTKYKVEELSAGLKEKMTNPNAIANVDLPPKNILIPKNFDVLNKNPEYSQKPQLLKQTDSYDLWYQKDDKFERPKAYVSLKIYSDDCLLGKDPKSRVFVNLWNEVAGEYMREFNYMANCANMSLEVSPLFDNVNFRWQGFSDSMPTYID